MSSGAVLELAARQQSIVQAVLAGEEITSEQLAALAEPLPRHGLGAPLDVELLRSLQASATALVQELDRRLTHVGERLGEQRRGGAARYLDTSA